MWQEQRLCAESIPLLTTGNLYLVKPQFFGRILEVRCHFENNFPMNTSSSKIDPTSWKKAFDALPRDHKNSLCFLALYAAPVRKIRIQEFCGCLNVTPDRSTGKPLYPRSVLNKNTWDQNKIKKIIDELKQLGWIDLTAEGFLHCKSHLRERIVHHLHATGQYQRFADVLFPIIGGRYFVNHYSEQHSWDRPKHPEDIVRELRHLLLSGNTKPLREVFHYLEQYDGNGDFFREIQSLFITQDGFNWLSEAKIEFRCLMLQYLLLRSLSQLDQHFDGV